MKPLDAYYLSFRSKYGPQRLLVLLFGLLLPVVGISQEGYTYKDKEFKFEVYLPKKPGDINDKPIHQILCTQSVSNTFHILVFSAKVKINKETLVKTVDEQLSAYKTGTVYKITGSTEFTVDGINVIDFWGSLSGQNLVSRMFVYKDFVYQFSMYSNGEIEKEMYYPFVNSIKLSNGAIIKSSDYDPNVYKVYNFDKKRATGNTAIDASPDVIGTSAAKVALVIGIKNYEAVPPLTNTINDARDISASLKARAFSVIELYDPKTKAELRNAVIEFNKALRDQPNGVGMLYYSGHGMQVDGVNYLIPASATLEIKSDIEEQCLNVDYILRAMEESGNQLNIIVLDACRNNPFRSFSRSADKGLNMVDAPKGSYIVFATKPGSVASDGTGRNGLFTSKLLKFISTQGLSLEDVFKNVAAEVAKDSNDQQRPWISSDFTGIFFFNPK